MSLITDVEDYLKDVYADGFVDESTRIHTMLDLMRKTDDLGGLNNYYLVKYANSQNIALGDDNIAAAQAVNTSSKAVKFTFEESIMTGEAVLPITQLEHSLRGNTQAFGDLIETEVDGMRDEFVTRRAFQLYGDGSNARGKIATGGISSLTLTLAQTGTAINFNVGMTLKGSSNADGSSPYATTYTVTGVDIDGDTIDVDVTTNLVAGTSYLFAATEISEFAIEGLQLTCPAVAPVKGSDSFRGKDRGVDPVRLAGSRLTSAQATGPLEQNLQKLIAKIRNVSGKVDFATCNSIRAYEMRTRLGAKVYYEPGGQATYGFSGFMLDTPYGQVKVMDDPDCPTTGAWVGQGSTHRISTLGEFVRIDDADGNWAYKKPSNNQIGVRIRSVCQYIPKSPRSFGYCPIG